MLFFLYFSCFIHFIGPIWRANRTCPKLILRNHGFDDCSLFEFPTTKTSILKQKSVLCVRITCHIEKIPPLCDWCQYVRQTWQTTSWITHLYVYMYVTSSSFIWSKIRCSLSTQIWKYWNGLQHHTVVQVHIY